MDGKTAKAKLYSRREILFALGGFVSAALACGRQAQPPPEIGDIVESEGRWFEYKPAAKGEPRRSPWVKVTTTPTEASQVATSTNELPSSTPVTQEPTGAPTVTTTQTTPAVNESAIETDTSEDKPIGVLLRYAKCGLLVGGLVVGALLVIRKRLSEPRPGLEIHNHDDWHGDVVTRRGWFNSLARDDRVAAMTKTERGRNADLTEN